jgi:hypothetical protein
MGIFPEDRPKPKGLLDAILNVGAGLARDVPRAANWWVESMKKGPEAAQQQVLDIIGGAAEQFATLPKRAYGASEEMRTEGTYNPEPIVEAATLPMGTGAIAGVPLKAGEAAFGAGILRPKKDPKLIGVLHGTGSPVEYNQMAVPPVAHDLGLHATIDAPITEGYALKHGSNLEGWPYVVRSGEQPKIDFMSGMRFDAPEATGPRNKPYLLDTKSSMKYPMDAIKWNEADNVISPIIQDMQTGGVYPRGLLEDMKNISGSGQMWQDQFIPMMKDRGIDSLFYPHAGSAKHDTFMAFDPKQLIPKYSEEGMELAAKRGVVEPMQHASRYGSVGAREPWRLPRSILHKPDEFESLVKDPKKNTAQWWDDSAPDSHIKQLSAKHEKLNAEADAAYEASMKKWDALNDLNKELKAGKVADEDYVAKYNELQGSTYGEKMLAQKKIDFKWDELWKQKKAGKITQEDFDIGTAALDQKKQVASGVFDHIKPKYTPDEMHAKIGNLETKSKHDFLTLIAEDSPSLTHAQKQQVENHLLAMFHNGQISDGGFTAYQKILHEKTPPQGVLSKSDQAVKELDEALPPLNVPPKGMLYSDSQLSEMSTQLEADLKAMFKKKK